MRNPNFTFMINFFRLETQRKPMISQFGIIIVKFTYSNLIFYVTGNFCQLILQRITIFTPIVPQNKQLLASKLPSMFAEV